MRVREEADWRRTSSCQLYWCNDRFSQSYDFSFFVVVKNFPTEYKLKSLIQNYSVTHIIFHWDLLRNYQKDLQVTDNVLTKINQIKKYGRIIYSDEKQLLLKTQEYIPIKTIIRTYSLYHLRKKRLKIILYDKYSGTINVLLNNRRILKRELNSNSFYLDIKRQALNISGNRIEVIFEQPILLRSIKFTN